jgi:hypothetical protein
MNNENMIPDEIINLVNTKAFANLSVEEKKMIEKFVTAQEYDAIHEANQITKQYFDDNMQPSYQVKQNLDDAFKQKFKNKKSILLSTLELWKVAAVVLFLFVSSLWYFKNNFVPRQSNNLLVHDTIFVEKKNNIIQHIIDTVIEYKYVQDASKKKTRLQIRNIVMNNDYRHDTASIKSAKDENIGIRTLRVEDLNKDLPNNNGKSMQEDDLVKRFNFAKI